MTDWTSQLQTWFWGRDCRGILSQSIYFRTIANYLVRTSRLDKLKGKQPVGYLFVEGTRVPETWRELPRAARNTAARGRDRAALRCVCQTQRWGKGTERRTRSRLVPREVKTWWVPFRVREILKASKASLCRTVRDFIFESGLCGCEVTHTGFAAMSLGSHSLSLWDTDIFKGKWHFLSQ